MKRVCVICLAMIVALFILSGCSSDKPVPSARPHEDDSRQQTETSNVDASLDVSPSPVASRLNFNDSLYSEHPVAEEWNHHAAIIDSDGVLWMWGSNAYGQLGNGDGKRADAYNPIRIMDDVVSVSTGATELLNSGSTFALQSDGTLWSWGGMPPSTGGDGRLTYRQLTPTKILDDVVSISAGKTHAVALKKDNSLWVWGNNNKGFLGDGTQDEQYIPVKIMADVVYASAGTSCTFALKKDGSLWCWGNVNYGKLGIGEYQPNEILAEPQKVMDSVLYVDAGEQHTIVLKTDGSVWCSGENHVNQLGDGTDDKRNEFVKVLEDAVFVSAGGSSSAAIKKDGSLWTWGMGVYDPNEKEPIGDIRPPHRSPVKSLDNVRFVTVSDNCVLAVRNDDTVWGWRTPLATTSGNTYYAPLTSLMSDKPTMLFDLNNMVDKTTPDKSVIPGAYGERNADYDNLDKFLTYFVEKEGQMYDIEPLEYDGSNYDVSKLLQFVFVRIARITDTDDGFIKEYIATASDMDTLMDSLFSVDVSQYMGADITVPNGMLERVYDSRSPYYSQTIEWGARGTYDTWAETESISENGDGSLTVIANVYNSVNPAETKDLNRKITVVVVPDGQSYKLLSFQNMP